MERIIMHIDVNNAFLSWTAVDLLKHGHKDIRNEYSVIGGDESKRRGIVLSKSTPAKKKGVKTAETIYQARKKCPNLKVYPPNHKLYKEMSNKLFELLSKYTNDIEVVSIDECFLDYGKVKKIYGDEVSFAYKIKDEIYNTLGFTVNVGIANNKLCAKMASDFSKPNKVHTLYMNEVKEKMWPLPIGDLYGIGKSSEIKLKNLKINTIEDLALADSKLLRPYFKNQTDHIINIANGIDDSRVISEESDRTSISTTETLIYDYDDINEINKELKEISSRLSKELKKKNKYCYTIAIIIKDMYFKTTTRQTKLKNSTNNEDTIYEVSTKLFKDNWDSTPVRLIGIRLDSLTERNDYQISLFENAVDKIESDKLNKTIDYLKEKYGNNIIK
ncbi:MAG: DNA polymerase IV [Bacilli bacterium]|nr:DNA polymerase IV [Bacilli bacterium]